MFVTLAPSNRPSLTLSQSSLSARRTLCTGLVLASFGLVSQASAQDSASAETSTDNANAPAATQDAADHPAEASATPESSPDATETDATETDATETDATETDATETDATETTEDKPDVNEASPEEAETPEASEKKPSEQESSVNAESETESPVNETETSASTSNFGRKLRQEYGGRIGMGKSFGQLRDSVDMNDLAEKTFALRFDAGFRLTPALMIGLYVDLAPGLGGDVIDECDECSAISGAVGLQFMSHSNPGGMIDLWWGAGAGIEFLTVSRNFTSLGITNGGDVVEVDMREHATYSAVPQVAVQAGLDFGNDRIAFGPYFSASYARFSSVESEIECIELGCPIGISSETEIPDDDVAGHSWITVGLRGTYLK